jgi:hypothetical protein
MRLSHLSMNLKLRRRVNRALCFLGSVVFRWITSVHRLNLELRFFSFRKSVPQRVLCLQPSLKCWTDRCDHHHGRLFDYLLTSCTALTPLPHTSNNWPWIFDVGNVSGITTESHYKILRGTKFRVSLSLQINLYPEQHLTVCLFRYLLHYTPTTSATSYLH